MIQVRFACSASRIAHLAAQSSKPSWAGVTPAGKISISLSWITSINLASPCPSTAIGWRLAPGWDDGAGASGGLDFGAAYLFSFTDNLFGGGVLEATIGEGYSGGKNIDLSASLDTVDQFALEQLGLDGNRLVVGARFDDGSGNGSINTGAAYLFTFSDSTFNGGQHVGTIGDGLQHLTEGCRYFVHPR